MGIWIPTIAKMKMGSQTSWEFVAGSRISAGGSIRGHGMYDSEYRSYNRGFGRGQPKPFQPPSTQSPDGTETVELTDHPTAISWESMTGLEDQQSEADGNCLFTVSQEADLQSWLVTRTCRSGMTRCFPGFTGHARAGHEQPPVASGSPPQQPPAQQLQLQPQVQQSSVAARR